MKPLLSFVATLGLLGVAFFFLHLVILWLRLPDLAGLMLLALPVVSYIGYSLQDTLAQAWRAALRIYLVFAAVTLSAAGLVYLIE